MLKGLDYVGRIDHVDHSDHVDTADGASPRALSRLPQHRAPALEEMS